MNELPVIKIYNFFDLVFNGSVSGLKVYGNNQIKTGLTSSSSSHLHVPAL